MCIILVWHISALGLTVWLFAVLVQKRCSACSGQRVSSTFPLTLNFILCVRLTALVVLQHPLVALQNIYTAPGRQGSSGRSRWTSGGAWLPRHGSPGRGS